MELFICCGGLNYSLSLEAKYFCAGAINRSFLMNHFNNTMEVQVKSIRLSAVIALLLSGALVAGISLAAKEKGPGGPPPEIQACKSKKAGDACSFRTRDGSSKNDTCKEITTPAGNELSCGDMPKPPRGGEKEKQD
jgi:hypothetical protein